MKTKLMTVALLVTCGALVMAAVAMAAAETTVTIRGEGTGDPFGVVKSPREGRCADGRLVKVYKQKGGEQGGGDDIYTGLSDTASLSNGKYRWNVGQPNLNGKHYARAPKIDGCKADNSKTINL